MGFSAADWCDVICICLNDEDIGVDIDPNSFPFIVEFIVADNCSTNQRLCTDLGVPRLHRTEGEEEQEGRGDSRRESHSSHDPEAR